MNYYDVLGISSKSGAEQIRKAYRNLAKKYHPDFNKEKGAREKFQKVNEAYTVLSDPSKKSAYDRSFASSSIYTNSNSKSKKSGKNKAKSESVKIVLAIFKIFFISTTISFVYFFALSDGGDFEYLLARSVVIFLTAFFLTFDILFFADKIFKKGFLKFYSTVRSVVYSISTLIFLRWFFDLAKNGDFYSSHRNFIFLSSIIFAYSFGLMENYTDFFSSFWMKNFLNSLLKNVFRSALVVSGFYLLNVILEFLEFGFLELENLHQILWIPVIVVLSVSNLYFSKSD